MIRSIAILMLLSLTATGCTFLTGLGGMTAHQQTMMCPVPPALSIETIEGGYRVSKADMQLLLKYITDLEYASGCR